MNEPNHSESVYRGKQFDVVVEEWGGRSREIVVHGGSAAIVAVDGDRYVTLVRQFREPARRSLLELPAGTLEPGESPLETARRELEEEVGQSGGTWTELASFFTTPGFCSERMHVFLAEGVETGDANPEEDEQFELVRWHASEIERRLYELEDAKTIAGLLLYLARQT